jgi:hypothetical protein
MHPVEAELFHADGQRTDGETDVTKLSVVVAILRTRLNTDTSAALL